MRHEVQHPPIARPRSPSRLGLTLSFALLAGLLAWRWLVPAPPIWLDAMLLAAAGVALGLLRARLRGPGNP